MQMRLYLPVIPLKRGITARIGLPRQVRHLSSRWNDGGAAAISYGAASDWKAPSTQECSHDV